MSSKIRIKMGAIEVECEGTEDFLKKELPEILEAVSKLYKNSSVDAGNGIGAMNADDTKVPPLSTANIASELKCKTGPELIKAACAHLVFIENLKEFTRQQILKDMKEATAYYKQNYSRNLSRYLKQLMEQKVLIERSKNHYALSAESEKELKSSIVN